jgi:hypothetical protein
MIAISMGITGNQQMPELVSDRVTEDDAKSGRMSRRIRSRASTLQSLEMTR